jgi:hypothetical protein
MATKEYPFTKDCSIFYQMVLSQTMWKVPNGIEVDKELLDLLKKLITSMLKCLLMQPCIRHWKT